MILNYITLYKIDQFSIIFLDPSLPAGKRREIDNVMKKARANTNDYWDKKLLEMEEKDPNRWRHTGYKKMYIEGELSSGESDRDGYRGYNMNDIGAGRSGGRDGGMCHNLPPSMSSSGRYGRSRSPRSRSRSRLRKSPPLSPLSGRRRSPIGGMMSSRDMHVDHHISGRGGGSGRMSPPLHHHSSYDGGPLGRSSGGGGGGIVGRLPRSPPERGGPRSPSEMMGNRRPLNSSGRPRSPPEPPIRRRSRSPVLRRRVSPTNISMSSSREMSRRRSPPSLSSIDQLNSKSRNPQILPRSKRPPSPPPPRVQ